LIFFIRWCGFFIKWIGVIKIGFGLVSGVVKVNLIFCTPLI
jgi:hypothetical protein